MEYLDFEIEIGAGQGRNYPVEVMRSPAGERHGSMHFPFDELELENHLLRLQNALLATSSMRRRISSPSELAVQEFGTALCEALLVGDIRTCWELSRREAQVQDRGLRLKLRITDPALATLPWEFLYDRGQGEFMALSRYTPIVRYIDIPRVVQPLIVTPPIRILGMIASPDDLPPLNVEREKQRVERAVDRLVRSGLLELTWLEGGSWQDLQRAMRQGPWHIFHFVGHGRFDAIVDEGTIALVGETGDTEELTATQVGRLLADHPSLRLALLNACEGAKGGKGDVFSGTAAMLVRRGMPAVVAMQYEITDRAAIEFARTFYEAVADELPLDAAVAEARKAVSLSISGTVEWGTPVLYMRSPDGVLFRVNRTALPRAITGPVTIPGPATETVPVGSAPAPDPSAMPPESPAVTLNPAMPFEPAASRTAPTALDSAAEEAPASGTTPELAVQEAPASGTTPESATDLGAARRTPGTALGSAPAGPATTLGLPAAIPASPAVSRLMTGPDDPPSAPSVQAQADLGGRATRGTPPPAWSGVLPAHDVGTQHPGKAASPPPAGEGEAAPGVQAQSPAQTPAQPGPPSTPPSQVGGPTPARTSPGAVPGWPGSSTDRAARPEPSAGTATRRTQAVPGWPGSSTDRAVTPGPAAGGPTGGTQAVPGWPGSSTDRTARPEPSAGSAAAQPQPQPLVGPMEFAFLGTDGRLQINSDWIILSRHGEGGAKFRPGEWMLPMSRVTAVHVAPATPASRGFIQVCYEGGPQTRATFWEAGRHPDTVQFTLQQQALFDTARQWIEYYAALARANAGRGQH